MNLTGRSVSRSGLQIEGYHGADAVAILRSPGFQDKWRSLFARCPWASCMQLPEYVLTWYDYYGDESEPLVLASFSASGELQGLLTLAVDKQTRLLTFAGAHQAEYQVWLAPPGEQRFIGDALQRLGDLGFSVLQFKYAPAGTPLEWLSQEQHRWGRTTVLDQVRRPLMRIGGAEEIRDSLGKKSNRSRINRLERSGPLRFRQLHQPEELDVLADDIIQFTDFRQGAIHGSFPFRGDPRKYAFCRALMQFPGLIHVTAMTLADKVIAVHIGMVNGKQIASGIIAHSPFVAEHSPGKLHILYLGLLLAEQGVAEFDLTPGGDAYKERFATHHDHAYRMTVFLNRGAWLRHRASAVCMRGLKRLATILGIDSRKALAKASLTISRLSHVSLTQAVRRVWSTTEMRFYRMPVTQVPHQLPTEIVREGALSDLLCYQPAESWQPDKRTFLSTAMSRIEKGSRFYTRAEDGLLVHWGWLTIGQTRAHITEVQHEYEYPPRSAVLWDYYTHPNYQKREYLFNSLTLMLHELGKLQDLEFTYIAVQAENWPSRRVIEKVGFQYQDSIVRRKRFFSVQFSAPPVSNRGTQKIRL
jgi:CelD/BcsL family acetyltransferase involved in cellulose biosynthesis/RimJ/RimL family protein N-acetyltransferase